MLFASALNSGKYIPLALVAVTAVLTLTYSVRSYLKVFTGELTLACSKAEETHPVMLVPLVLLAAGAITSWLIIGNYTGALSQNGIIHEVIGIVDLIKETVESTALLLSLAALAVGISVVVKTRSAKRTGEPPLIAVWAMNGFGFDQFYLTVFGGAHRIVIRVLPVIDLLVDSIRMAVLYAYRCFLII